MIGSSLLLLSLVFLVGLLEDLLGGWALIMIIFLHADSDVGSRAATTTTVRKSSPVGAATLTEYRDGGW